MYVLTYPIDQTMSSVAILRNVAGQRTLFVCCDDADVYWAMLGLQWEGLDLLRVAVVVDQVTREHALRLGDEDTCARLKITG